MTQEQPSGRTAATLSNLVSGLGHGLGQMRIGIAGLWLILLYVTFGTFVMYSLAAHQLHHAIQSFEINEKPITVWQVVQAHKKWRVASDALKRSSADLSLASKRVRQWETDHEELKRRFDANARIAVVAEATLNGLLEVEGLDPTLRTKLALAGYDLSEIEPTAQTDVVDALKNSNNYQDRRQEFSTARIENAELERQIADARARIEQQKSDVEFYNTRVTNAGEALTQALILDGEKLDARIGDFLDALTYLEASEANWFLPDFSRMPSDMLTLVLVLAMGALGGTIHLTKLYFDQRRADATPDQAKGAAYFLFRPFLGAITALSVFILAKAGVLVVASPNMQGIGANLSPFFIAFVGIISGLLAEQALATIQTAGEKWFHKTEVSHQERWAVKLDQALGASPEEVASNSLALVDLLKIAPQDLNAWINEERPVPQRHQMVIAAFVRKPLRELFSDLRNAGPAR